MNSTFLRCKRLSWDECSRAGMVHPPGRAPIRGPRSRRHRRWPAEDIGTGTSAPGTSDRTSARRNSAQGHQRAGTPGGHQGADIRAGTSRRGDQGGDFAAARGAAGFEPRSGRRRTGAAPLLARGPRRARELETTAVDSAAHSTEPTQARVGRASGKSPRAAPRNQQAQKPNSHGNQQAGQPRAASNAS